MSTDPRIASLAGAAEAAARDNASRITAGVDRAGPWATLRVDAELRQPFNCPAGADIGITSFLDIEQLEELIRELLAIRADLAKLHGGK